MADVEVKVDNNIIQTGSDPIDVVVDTESIEVHPSDYSNRISINDSLRVVEGEINSYTTEFTIPDTTIDGLQADIDTLMRNLDEALAGQEVAIIDSIKWEVENVNGIIRKKLEELDVKYVEGSKLNEYIRTAELSTHKFCL